MKASDTESESFRRQFLGKFGLRRVFVAVGCAVVILIGFSWLNHSNSESLSFTEIVVGELTAGSSIDDVRQLLGKSEILEIGNVPSWAKSWDERSQDYFPAGVQSGDTFLHYFVPNEAGSDEWYFQFRDGKLVNFDPAWYAESRSLIAGLAN